MKSLPTLIKLEKARVDDHRRMLADLLGLLERIEAEIEHVQAERLNEEAVARKAAPAERMTLEAFVTQAKKRLEQLAKARGEAQDAIEAQREKLAEAFETQKRYEIIRDQQAEAQLDAEKREEQLTLDETAAQAHERKDG